MRAYREVLTGTARQAAATATFLLAVAAGSGQVAAQVGDVTSPGAATPGAQPLPSAQLQPGLQSTAGAPVAAGVEPTPGVPSTPSLQLAPGLQPLVLGTTDTRPLFATTGLGYAGGPATYTGFGIGGFGAGGLGSLIPAAPAAPPSRLVGGNPLLPPILPGAEPIQLNNDRAPWQIISPSIGISTGFDDNPRTTPNRLADSTTSLSPALIVSADTPHFQGLLTSSFEFQKFARATEQDRLNADGAAFGLATIFPEHLYVDGRASVFQVSPLGGGGFTNPQFGSLVQPQSVLTTSVTPVWRQAFGDLVATDLRYSHESLSPISGLVGTGSTSSAAGVTDTESNRGGLIVALGQGGGVLAGRVALSAADIASQSDAASTQVRSTGELQYRINPEIALFLRGGYENLRYPNAGLAFPGPVEVAGIRLDLSPRSALAVNYGREDGGWGLNGALVQSLTPRTLLRLSYHHGIGSRQEEILSNLNASRLDAYGTVVDAETALPLALANPELSFSQSGVFRAQQIRGGIEHEFETDSVRLFAFFEKQSSLEATVSGDLARGVDVSWFRAMTPRLTGGVSVGAASHVGSKTLSTQMSLNYNVRMGVDGVLSYQFQDVIANSGSGMSSYIRNIALVGIRAGF